MRMFEFFKPQIERFIFTKFWLLFVKKDQSIKQNVTLKLFMCIFLSFSLSPWGTPSFYFKNQCKLTEPHFTERQTRQSVHFQFGFDSQERRTNSILLLYFFM